MTEITQQMDRKAVAYLNIPYSIVNDQIKIADKGVAKPFTLNNPEDMLRVVMKMGDISRDDILEYIDSL